MSVVSKGLKGERVLLMGNDAIARGALEAGVKVVAGYPGTPHPKSCKPWPRRRRITGCTWNGRSTKRWPWKWRLRAHIAGLRSMAVMKQVGVNVASDFLLHLAEYGTRGGMVLVSCEDPGALSSTNEGDSRHYAKMMEFPLVEPGDFQEAKDMAKWSFELSEKIRNVVMFRSVTRMSHASGNLTIWARLPSPSSPVPVRRRHSWTRWKARCSPSPAWWTPCTAPVGKAETAREIFETSPFNTYTGPKQPELLVITSSAASLYTARPLPCWVWRTGGAVEAGHHLAPSAAAAGQTPGQA
jgi:indolepyruvate ferredoxin oxidoreductase alpha subunit